MDWAGCLAAEWHICSANDGFSAKLCANSHPEELANVGNSGVTVKQSAQKIHLHALACQSHADRVGDENNDGGNPTTRGCLVPAPARPGLRT